MTHTRQRAGRRALLASAAVLALGTAACNPDDALDVDDVDVVTPGSLTGKGALPGILNSTVANFQIAFSGGGDLTNGGHEGQVNMVGLFTDELLHAETFTDRQLVDQRIVQPGNGSMKAVFLDLSLARAFADFGSRRFNEFDPGTAAHAEVLSLGAYAYLLFAENYCSGIPFSTLNDDGTLSFGEPQAREQILQVALAKFDSALAFARSAGDTEQEHLAQLGKARTLLSQGRFVDARAAIAGVPTGFAYIIQGSDNSTRQNNGVWNYTVNFPGFSVSDEEGGNGLPFFSASDPRVPAFDTEDVGFDGATPFLLQQKYPRLDSDVTLASGIEARLIEAEVAVRIDRNAARALQILNALRAADGLAELSDPGSESAMTDLVFRERAFWLYLTAHRLGDLRRLVRQYGRPQSSVFPTGDYHKGGSYGSDVNFPVSADEENNPSFNGCVDRNA